VGASPEGKLLGVKAIITGYFVAALLLALVWIATPGLIGEAGYLLLGAMLSTVPMFLIEEFRSREESVELTRAISIELARNIARCCFDFEAPWKGHLAAQGPLRVRDLQKFTPQPPVIFQGAGSKIAKLPGTASRSVISYYHFYEAWHRDVSYITAECLQTGERVQADQLRFLARRLRQTLEPALAALSALRQYEPEIDAMTAEFLAPNDKLFPGAHPHAGKPAFERIQIALTETQDH
jgi:hypothetical protein